MESKNINTNIDKLLLVPSRNGQSQNLAMAESGLIKPRIRYSGAARRRYKKMKERGELFENIQNSPSPIVSRSVNKEDAPINSQKRVMPEQSPCDSPNSHQNKKPKITDEKPTHAQAVARTKIAFVPEGYPDKRLSADEGGVVKKLIRERILQLPEDAVVPTFIGTWERDGAVIFNCANEASMDWLKSLSTEIKVEDTPLYVLPADELPKRHWIVVHSEESDLTAEEVIKLLDKQNVGLVAKEWIIVKGSESKSVKSTHFAALITDLSLEGLKACGYKPFCGLGRATVKLLEKGRGEGTEQTTHRVTETV
ncbi:uncharacterized protein LOC105203618 [Solenopsis invicta]|uniref:uncharacterized protein LOC105203618 n=1 Tax=Solenopsis invicta TaxID=13686 RepID=UPI000595EF73|nr:uncharacterized protein LOC105203618 [Solenopsis invicta]